MSVYYEIKEHLSLLPGADSSVASLFGKRLAMLGADMLMEYGAHIDTLRVKKGDCEVSFTGHEVNEDLKKAVLLLVDAPNPELEEPLEAELCYEFRWSAWDEAFSDEISPFGFCDFLGKLEDDKLKYVHYVMWNNSDCGEGMGAITFYGADNAGAVQRGIVGIADITELPEDASWYCNKATYIYDGPFNAAIAEACRKLSITCGNPTPEVGETFTYDGHLCQSSPDLIWEGGEEGEYLLEAASLPDKESVAAFTAAITDVLRATGEESYAFAFFDINARIPRMLFITVEKEGSVRYEMTVF